MASLLASSVVAGSRSVLRLGIEGGVRVKKL